MMSSSPSARASFDFEQLAAPPQTAPAPSLEGAARKARDLVAAAQAEADRIHAEARDAGFQEGFAAGHQAAREDLAPALSALVGATEELRELKATAADAVEQHAVDLAIRVAEKVLAGTLAVEPERVLDVIRGALRTIVDRERVVLQVSPEDLVLVREAIDEVAGSLGGIEHIDVQEERRAQRGGAVLRTALGEVDARIETKLDRARAAIETELAR
jgi:flagellar biosynthesis/type III secretory pathway protein FliH